ncbi:MAG: hypothetical protein ACOZQL_20050 [Myxococcota bacterium]
MLVLSLCASMLLTAPPADDAGLAAMKALSFLSGRWEGEGWLKQGPGEPQRFKGQETVEARLDGRLLTIEGVHRGGTPEHVVHHAFALVSAQPGGGYRFQSFLADGRALDARGKLEAGAFVWTFEHPQAGQLRYTIRVSADTWLEVGESSRDGKTWVQVFEMRLTRMR